MFLAELLIDYLVENGASLRVRATGITWKAVTWAGAQFFLLDVIVALESFRSCLLLCSFLPFGALKTTLVHFLDALDCRIGHLGADLPPLPQGHHSPTRVAHIPSCPPRGGLVQAWESVC